MYMFPGVYGVPLDTMLFALTVSVVVMGRSAHAPAVSTSTMALIVSL